MRIAHHLLRTTLSAAAACLSALPGATMAAPAPLAPERVNEIVDKAMHAFATPGMAVGIVQGGRLVYAGGFGVRESGKAGRVTPDTIFQVGSNTKAFTAAALAILVDRGALHWDDKVIDHLPQFRLNDAWVTREFTVRDLLSHRSGLGKEAGDLMFFPATDLSRAEVMQGLRYLKPTGGFRAGYAYENVFYLVAGELIPAVTGRSWEEFVEQEILGPLQMKGCAANFERLADKGNIAAPHVMAGGRATPIPVDSMTVVGAAATLNCNLAGLSRWVATQLGEGQAPGGVRLFSAAQSAQMWTVQTPQTVPAEIQALLHTHLKGYGLGWELQDEFGYLRVSHTGAVPGMTTWISLIPELDLGVIVLTNQETGLAMEAVGNQILDAYVGAPSRDLVALLSQRAAAGEAEDAALDSSLRKGLDAAKAPPFPLDRYAGRFHDAWRGDATVTRDAAGLRLKFGRTAKLDGELRPWLGNTFVVRWADRTLNADAFVRFSQGFDGGIDGFTMKAISASTDFSFDFQDLAFERVKP